MVLTHLLTLIKKARQRYDIPLSSIITFENLGCGVMVFFHYHLRTHFVSCHVYSEPVMARVKQIPSGNRPAIEQQLPLHGKKLTESGEQALGSTF